MGARCSRSSFEGSEGTGPAGSSPGDVEHLAALEAQVAAMQAVLDGMRATARRTAAPQDHAAQPSAGAAQASGAAAASGHSGPSAAAVWKDIQEAKRVQAAETACEGGPPGPGQRLLTTATAGASGSERLPREPSVDLPRVAAVGATASRLPLQLLHEAEPAPAAAAAASAASYLIRLCDEDSCVQMAPDARTGDLRLGPASGASRSKPFKKLRWASPPMRALVVKKPRDEATTAAMFTVIAYLRQRGVEVWVEPAVVQEEAGSERAWELHTWAPDERGRLHAAVSFVVCLGGDGTILWASDIFGSHSVPPVVAFSLGSLGFLAAFEWSEHEAVLSEAIRGDFFVTMRTRLVGKVVRPGTGGEGEGDAAEDYVTATNEVVIDRGPEYALINLELFCDGLPLTNVQADGVIIATPTGSTAYSLAAGGPLMHPAMDALVICPICPHVLSFRPMLLPDSVVLKVRNAHHSRCSAWVAFDGRHRTELRRGDSVVLQVSRTPLVAMCRHNETQDWFEAVKQGLHWNNREQQKAYEITKPALNTKGGSSSKM